MSFISQTAKRTVIKAVIPKSNLYHDKLKYAIKRLELDEELLELLDEQELDEQELEHELELELEVWLDDFIFVTLAGSERRLVYFT